jgi:hypothetical protein
MFVPALRRGDPVAVSPRWVVANMLMMSAIKFGDPVLPLIQMKINYLPWRPN